MSFAIVGSFLTKLMGPIVCKVLHAGISVAIGVVQPSHTHVLQFRKEKGSSKHHKYPTVPRGSKFRF